MLCFSGLMCPHCAYQTFFLLCSSIVLSFLLSISLSFFSLCLFLNLLRAIFYLSTEHKKSLSLVFMTHFRPRLMFKKMTAQFSRQSFFSSNRSKFETFFKFLDTSLQPCFNCISITDLPETCQHIKSKANQIFCYFLKFDKVLITYFGTYLFWDW